MKKLLSLLLSLSLALILFGCGRGETEPTELESVEATQVTEPPTETAEVIEETQSPVPEGMVCLEDVIAGSDIVMTVEGEKITLEEDGLVLELSTQWKLGHRNGYAVAALQSAPQILEGKVYVEEWFCKYFLGAEELEQPTLFHQIQFFAGEILEAIEEPEASEFNRKLIQQVF